jgi:hypothetical protein
MSSEVIERDDDGIVVLDTNALKVFESPEARDRILTTFSTQHLAIWPSALNVLEIVKMKNPRIRGRLLSTIRELSSGRALLPMPLSLLKRVAESIVSGESGFRTGPTGIEWVVNAPERLNDQQIAQTTRSLRESQDFWDAHHRLGRIAVRAKLKEAGVTDPRGTVAVFLQQQWTKVTQLDSFIDSMWAAFSLPGLPTYEALIENEAWRLYFEGLGATIYERCIPNQAPKPAHIADVIQLVYLAGAKRRVLVTNDNGFGRVATAILTNRYSNASVLTTSELLDTA